MQKVTIIVAIGLLLGATYIFWPAGEDPTGAPLAEVAVPGTLSAEATEGKGIFDTKCAACHGESAAGRDGVGPPLVHKIYEPGHHGDRAFLAAATTGVRQHHWPFGNMPPVEGVTLEEVAKIVVYVRELQRANGIE
tara:strand:- start:10374 stop:10781 length:408 start_codon:yes stop_codon:yes gene_type:complete